jgi:hypothetical protein
MKIMSYAEFRSLCNFPDRTIPEVFYIVRQIAEDIDAGVLTPQSGASCFGFFFNDRDITRAERALNLWLKLRTKEEK